MKREEYVRVVMPRLYVLRVAIAVAHGVRPPRPFTYLARR